MQVRGKTITTYLINGNPKGPRTVFISNKICQAIVVPRISLSEVKKRSELNQPALYFLVNEQDGNLYVGEKESFSKRVIDHQNKKSFWDLAIVFTSKCNDLTKTDVKYLEHLSYNEAIESDRFDLKENKQKSGKPNLPEYQADCVHEFFDDVKTLISFLGYPVFDRSNQEVTEIFYCTGRGANAKGFYHPNGFTVLKGSLVPSDTTKSYRNPEKRIKKLKTCGKDLGSQHFQIEKDILFSSPSSASSFCIGNSSNGWIDWVNKEKQTLDQVYRSE